MLDSLKHFGIQEWGKLGCPREDLGVEGPRETERGRMTKGFVSKQETNVSGTHKVFGSGAKARPKRLSICTQVQLGHSGHRSPTLEQTSP